MINNRFEERNREFQKTLDPLDLQRRREEFAVELRKSKRLQHLNKRRNIAETHHRTEFPPELESTYPSLKSSSFNEKFQTLYSILTTECPSSDKLNALISLRLVMIQKDAPFRALINLGFAPIVLGYLSPEHDEDFQKESGLIVCNLASGPHPCVETLVRYGAIKQCLRVINPSKLEVTENAIWALGNISGESPEYTKEVNNKGVLNLLIELLKEWENSITTRIARVSMWVVSNLVKNLYQIDKFIDQLMSVIKSYMLKKDKELFVHCLWCLSSIAKGNDLVLQKLIDSKILERIIHMDKLSKKALVPAIRTFGGVLSGSEEKTQFLLNLKVLDFLQECLKDNLSKIRKEALWAVSNVAAGTVPQVQSLVEHPLVVLCVKSLLDSEVLVRREASFVLMNASIAGGDSSIKALVNLGVFDYLVEALKNTVDQVVILNLIKFCRGLLDLGQREAHNKHAEENLFAGIFDSSGCIEAIESLQMHASPRIQNEALCLISDFFGFEESSQPMTGAPEYFEFS